MRNSRNPRARARPPRNEEALHAPLRSRVRKASAGKVWANRIGQNADIPNVRVQDLLSFRELALALNYLAAARQLAISQASLSRIIFSLERRFGVRLLDRTTRRVDLTDAGHLLFDMVERQLALLHQFAANAGTVPASGRRLSVAVSTTVGADHLTAIAAKFATANPSVELDFRDYPDDEIPSKVSAGKFTFGVAFAQPQTSRLHAVGLCGDVLCLVGVAPQMHHTMASSRAEAIVARPRVPLLSVLPTSVVRQVLEANESVLDFLPANIATAPTPSIVFARALAGASIGVVPLSILKQAPRGLIRKPLPYVPESPTLQLMKRTAHELADFEEDFVAIARRVMRRRGRLLPSPVLRRT
jgi:LysR family transcriptional regulator, carnitine catabolism transcriptional activator